MDRKDIMKDGKEKADARGIIGLCLYIVAIALYAVLAAYKNGKADTIVIVCGIAILPIAALLTLMYCVPAMKCYKAELGRMMRSYEPIFVYAFMGTLVYQEMAKTGERPLLAILALVICGGGSVYSLVNVGRNVAVLIRRKMTK